MDLAWLWVPATIFAAAAQAGRNAVQRGLTQTLGTLGATQVRFIYGFPFALLFLAVAAGIADTPLPGVNGPFLAYVAAGAVVQIAATALMLAAMRDRAFVVVTAWTKTEPVQVAVFGFAILGDPFTLMGAAAVVVATLGVILMSVRTGMAHEARAAGWRPTVLGLVSGAGFALASVSFRGAILSLEEGPFFLQASWSLVWSLGMQVVMLALWMLLFRRDLLRRCLAAWRVSIWGGLLGAAASQGWFLGFALTSAANVRTLGLLEVLFAQALSYRVFSQGATGREWAGIALIIAGVGMLLMAA
ncbi:DMT family transporter [Paracandidimonas soli]|uniref:EamA-like transporter family protein n=1 Tax=Paracandidimonas soli TaxID=1917182 RepID=A0A4R3UY70_9BURK|nr:DMT family transporter [Paracandidimonas soli]TCU97265.1 EamA-like transporter family protein [Paracandidimonas soli]